MVLSSSKSDANSASPTIPELEAVRRMPLKRRSLSRYYPSKAQSFTCFQELLGTPYGTSALALSKDCSTSRTVGAAAAAAAGTAPAPLRVPRTYMRLDADAPSDSSPLTSPSDDNLHNMHSSTSTSSQSAGFHNWRSAHAAAGHSNAGWQRPYGGMSDPGTPMGYDWMAHTADLCTALQLTSLSAPAEALLGTEEAERRNFDMPQPMHCRC